MLADLKDLHILYLGIFDNGAKGFSASEIISHYTT